MRSSNRGSTSETHLIAPLHPRLVGVDSILNLLACCLLKANRKPHKSASEHNKQQTVNSALPSYLFGPYLYASPEKSSFSSFWNSKQEATKSSKQQPTQF
jgi:hypothetical protein